MDKVTQEILLKHFNYLNGGLYYTLPIAKRTKVGEIVGECLSAQCSDKNDDGWTFPEIADYIELNWNPDAEETVE